MNREQIEQAANDRFSDNTFAYKGFIDGAEWRINSVWHGAEEEPGQNAWFIAQIGDDCFDTFVMQVERERWERWCKGMNIKRWAYVEDLLPERKENKV